jgi:hypothetical protein
MEIPQKFIDDPEKYARGAVQDRKRKQEDEAYRHQQRMDKIWLEWTSLADQMLAWAKELGVELEDVMYAE